MTFLESRRALLVLLAVFGLGGCVWSDVPKDAVFACGAGCPEAHACRNGYCFPEAPALDACTPITCRSRGATCGPLSNGCGAILDCGTCSGFDVCGGGAGGPNSCGCTPLAAAEACQLAGRSCGKVTGLNGCGVVADFSCGPPCAADGGCLAETNAELCSAARYSCGPLGVTDRCGAKRTVDCGACAANGACLIDPELIDGGLASRCAACEPESDATLCNRRGASCGTLPAAVADNCGILRTPSCGDCFQEDGSDACGEKGGSFDNVCGCQLPLAGCLVPEQCCAGATCGPAGMCCISAGQQCADDSDCCAGHCTGLADGGGAVCAVIASGP